MVLPGIASLYAVAFMLPVATKGEDILMRNFTDKTIAANTCFEVASTPGCSDFDCEDYICEEVDNFCCTKKWDEYCVRAATNKSTEACLVDWPNQSNDCFEIDPFRRPGCDIDNVNENFCRSTVCLLRPECCNISYDDNCVELALKKCDLPNPENSCFSESRLPRCLDDNKHGACLESVCQNDESCCDVAYGPQCVELARKDSKSCAPTVAPNTCYEPSPFGGCADRRCQILVCELRTSCCNNQEGIGMWDEYCVKGAKALCQPMIEERPLEEGDCPSGMICDFDSMANCTELVHQYKELFFFGNILGGVYCGDESPDRNGITNCPRGSYCPDPETILPCPAGYYCPFKTQEPAIICNRCLEGSLYLEKDMYGWVVLIGIFLSATAYIGWGLLSRYNKRLADHIKELETRIQSRISTGRSTKANELDQQKRNLKKLRPKLEVITYRLAKMECKSQTKKKKKNFTNTILGSDGDRVKFDATRLFDVLDIDASGDLTFDELNAILGLSDVELQEFIRRMNEMANVSSMKKSVTRSVFAKYFLQILTDTSNLTISFDEAEAVFDELVGGNKSQNKIHMNKFYASSMSDFLSDSQIFQLIRELKTLKSEANWGATTASTNAAITSMSNLRGSLVQLRSSRRPNNMEVQRATSISNRNSRLSQSMGILKQSSSRAQSEVKSMMIERNFFIRNYPQVLIDVMLNRVNTKCTGQDHFPGVDLCFKDLSLSVSVGKKTVDVVNEVTGRIRGKTMTALMGGSGAGKTSLLNALCGRAHYGETTGTVFINGHETDILKHVDCIGYVPQDDIIFPELTVRENFLFAGKFRLPKGTTHNEIEELADETIANLGLARVANSLVGDVKRRGVSGGEKKRVNIGIELMALPLLLFLDEPTSGLDASSALLVMKNLNHLVEKDGVTVVSVIHQPRKFIFDLFDSLILLGVGGQIVYHGPTEGAESYFDRLEYKLPKGESVADWLIDISSGRLESDGDVSLNRAQRQDKSLKEGQVEKLDYHVVTDGNCVGGKGVTTGKVVKANEDAKERRSWLYKKWIEYFEKLDDQEKSIYKPPESYDLPIGITKQSFWSQFIYQGSRALLVAWRNRFSKIINSTIIVGSVVFITALDGVTEVSIDRDPNLPFSKLVRPQAEDSLDIFKDIFAYTQNNGHFQYPMKAGVILSILIGLTASTNITSKRMEFFREAGSGYDLNAYFLAINILLTIEHSIQVLFAALFASWIRHPIASYSSYCIHFLLLAWLTVAWALLFPMICSPDTVILVTGFFFAFCGLIFSGAFPPFDFISIYEAGGIKEFIAGWISPTRFFFEAINVGELRCMPEQSGFTIEPTSFSRLSNTTMTRMMGFAARDLNAVRQSCNGWYWSVIPVIFIGVTIRYMAIGAMHACFRAQQAKKPLIYILKRDRSAVAIIILYFIGMIVLLLITTWLFTRDQPFQENQALTQIQLLNQYGFFD